MEESNQSINKMVVFDMDNTLLQGRFIDACAKKFNFTQALALLRQIDHDPVSLTQRIASFLKGKTKADLIEVASTIQLIGDIIEVVNELKKRSFTVGIISDSYQLITEFVAKRINADFWLANELLYNEDRLTGEVLIPSYFHYSEESSCKHQVCKTNALRYVCNKYNVKFENCIVVGDSENDICMIKHAGFGVAFCTTNELLKRVAKKHIEEKAFSELLMYAF
jgi:glucosyl-3-phosphoglycerate synthase